MEMLVRGTQTFISGLCCLFISDLPIFCFYLNCFSFFLNVRVLLVFHKHVFFAYAFLCFYAMCFCLYFSQSYVFTHLSGPCAPLQPYKLNTQCCLPYFSAHLCLLCCSQSDPEASSHIVSIYYCQRKIYIQGSLPSITRNLSLWR